VTASVLVIADHAEIATLVACYLTSAGFRPLVASHLRHATLILQREAPAAIVLDLATPGHCESVIQWVRRDPTRAGMAIVRVSARARHAGVARGGSAMELHVPKPFTPRQIVDGVRTALARRAARQRVVAPVVRMAS